MVAAYCQICAAGTDGAALPKHFLSGAIANQAWLYAYCDVYLAVAVPILMLAPWCMSLNRPTSARRVME